MSDDGRWRSSRKDFLVHVKPLSRIFRAKSRDELKKSELFAQVDTRVWQKDWVVHSEPGGSGTAAFQYLALLSCPHCGGPLTLLGPLAPRGRAP